jgi:protocatechuate 3,4-dioxygenase beta subunit
MDNDDRMIGRLLSRRRALSLLGAAGAAAGGLLTARGQSATPTALPGCVVRPALTEGPYFVDETPVRSDVRSDSRTRRASAGVPLRLTFAVSSVGTDGCRPLSGIRVDLWQCDALGVYSDVGSASGQDFLRGAQVTGRDGRATFTTVYPGWYPGRCVHVHFKLRTTSGRAQEFTSQLFFDEAVTRRAFQAEPYRRRGEPNTPNARDMIYRNGGHQLLVTPTGDTIRGFAATFEIGMNLR